MVAALLEGSRARGGRRPRRASRRSGAARRDEPQVRRARATRSRRASCVGDLAVGLELDALAGLEARASERCGESSQRILPAIHDRDPVAEEVRLLHRVRRQDDRELGVVLAQVAEHVPDRAPALRIQPRSSARPGRGRGASEHAARDLEASAHAARELSRDLVAPLPETDLSQAPLDPLRERPRPRGRTSCPGPRGSRGRSGSRPSSAPGTPSRSPGARRPSPRRCRDPRSARCRDSAAAASSACGSASSCRPRWGPGDRRSRRARRRTRRRRRRRSRRSAWSAPRPRSGRGRSSRPGRLAPGLDHEGLAGDDAWR